MLLRGRILVQSWELSGGPSSQRFCCKKNSAGSASCRNDTDQALTCRAFAALLALVCAPRYGDTMIDSADDYQLLMEQDGTYAEQSEAAVAAMLLGVELTIYASAAPPGVDPSPQNLYREAAGLGRLCHSRFTHPANRQHSVFATFRLAAHERIVCSRACSRMQGLWVVGHKWCC